MTDDISRPGNAMYVSEAVWNDLLGVGLPPSKPRKPKPPPKKNPTTPEAIQAYRDNYSTKCASCQGPLAGPGTDQEIKEQIEEHDQNFPGCSLDTSCTICDDCYSPPTYYEAWSTNG